MKKIILFLIIIVTASSCEKGFLDRTPYDGLSDAKIWGSEKNILMQMNGVYSTFARDAMYDFYWYITNIGPDGYAWVRGTAGLIQSQGLATARDDKFLTQYSAFYKTIKYANDAIANLPNNPSISSELSDRLVGEAKFLRGLSYFYLWDLYGGVIILDKPLNPADTYLPRNTAEEVKTFIINDFTDAIDKLPVSYESASDDGRVTKGAAIAMLGKTYLYDKQWANAAEQFGKLMNSPFSYQLVADYADIFNYKTQPNSERVFDIQYIMLEGYGSSFDNMYGTRIHNRGCQDYSDVELTTISVYTNLDGSPIDMSTMPKRINYPDDHQFGLDLISWYESTYANVDNRLHKSVIVPGATFLGRSNLIFKLYYPYADYVNADPPPIRTTFPNIALIPWRKFVTTGTDNLYRADCPTKNPLIRYADILLMYAEAKNETDGPTADVYNAVKQIRDRAGLVDLPAGLSKEDMQRNIWLERFREFPGEGMLYFDVRRWGTATSNDPVFGLNHDVLDFKGDRLFTKAFAERDYLWPIPAQEREINTILTQNPGW